MLLHSLNILFFWCYVWFRPGFIHCIVSVHKTIAPHCSSSGKLPSWRFGAFYSQGLLSEVRWEVEQEWRSGESTRLLPMCPGFDSRTRRHLWVEFVVGSLPSSERCFPRYSGFPLSSKTSISKFQFDLDWQALYYEPLALCLTLHFLLFLLKIGKDGKELSSFLLFYTWFLVSFYWLHLLI